MSPNSIITILGISILLIYGITKILDFYGIGSNIYGSYVAFYYFMLFTSFILPRDYPSINFNNNLTAGALHIVSASDIRVDFSSSAPPLVPAADVKII
jgi:hypothetical protein